MRKATIGLWALAAFMGFGASASADRVRCGQSLIGAGDSAVTFFTNCGLPAGSATYIDELGEIVQRYYLPQGHGKRPFEVEIVRGHVRSVESVRR